MRQLNLAMQKGHKLTHRRKIIFVKAVAQVNVKLITKVFAERNDPVVPAHQSQVQIAMEAIARANAAKLQSRVFTETLIDKGQNFTVSSVI